MNLSVLMTAAASRHGDRTPIRQDGVSLSYTALERATGLVAGLLREHDVQPGDRVGVMLPNVVYFPICYYGALRAGAAIVPMNMLLKERDGARGLRAVGDLPVAAFSSRDRERKPGSIGLPVRGVEMGLADVHDGVGEITIRGHNVMKGYWNNPAATAEAIDPDGWFHTGDLARIDEDGYFFIVDRKKEMIIRGGFNIYPREIEEVLHEHPDVMETAVVGLPHDELRRGRRRGGRAQAGPPVRSRGDQELRQGEGRRVHIPGSCGSRNRCRKVPPARSCVGRSSLRRASREHAAQPRNRRAGVPRHHGS